MNERSLFERWFKEKQGSYVDIIIAGKVFGGRLGESPQMPRAFQWVDDVLLIRFGTTERLVITGVRDVWLGGHNELLISATDARFGWHCYGRPQTPENWCEKIYRRKGDTIVLTRMGVLRPGTETFRFEGEEFVRLL